MLGDVVDDLALRGRDARDVAGHLLLGRGERREDAALALEPLAVRGLERAELRGRRGLVAQHLREPRLVALEALLHGRALATQCSHVRVEEANALRRVLRHVAKRLRLRERGRSL